MMSDTIGIDVVVPELKYARHVRIIGIVEAAIQAILVLLCVFEGIQVMNSGILSLVPVPILMLVLVLIYYLSLRGWVVYQVYVGGQERDAGRLTTWYTIQCVFFALGLPILLLDIFFMGMSGSLYTIVLISVMAYSVYSIYVVRCHVNDIKAQNSMQIYMPNRI